MDKGKYKSYMSESRNESCGLCNVQSATLDEMVARVRAAMAHIDDRELGAALYELAKVRDKLAAIIESNS